MNSITAIKIFIALVKILQYFVKNMNESTLIRIGQDKANERVAQKIIADELIARQINGDALTDKGRELIDDLFGERR